MKKLTWLIAIGVAAVFVVPAVVYAFDYANEYQVDVSITATSNELGVVDVTNVDTSVSEMGYWTFWDTFASHSAPDRSDYYTVYVEVTQDTSGATVTETEYLEVQVGASMDLSFTLYEVQPGDSTLRVYVHSMLTQSIVFDQSFDLLVG